MSNDAKKEAEEREKSLLRAQLRHNYFDNLAHVLEDLGHEDRHKVLTQNRLRHMNINVETLDHVMQILTYILWTWRENNRLLAEMNDDERDNYEYALELALQWQKEHNLEPIPQPPAAPTPQPSHSTTAQYHPQPSFASTHLTPTLTLTPPGAKKADEGG